jgi:hypothetical protein
MFCLHFAQYGLLHSCFFLFVSNLPHAVQFLFCSHCLSSYLIILILAKTSPTQEISRKGFERVKSRTGQTQSLHACSNLCHIRIASFIKVFTHIPFCHRICNIFDYMVMTCDIVIKVNSFSVWTCPSNIMTLPCKPENTIR